jgi:hypothetical protein
MHTRAKLGGFCALNNNLTLFPFYFNLFIGKRGSMTYEEVLIGELQNYGVTESEAKEAVKWFSTETTAFTDENIRASDEFSMETNESLFNNLFWALKTATAKRIAHAKPNHPALVLLREKRKLPRGHKRRR